mgnify:CR=1 FL=1
MSDSTFVRTMIALRRLPLGYSADTAARVRMRDSVLRAHGVTAAQIESVAVKLADDPDRAAGIWRVIESAMAPPPSPP